MTERSCCRFGFQSTK